MISPDFIKHLILWGKIAGSFSALGGLIYGCLKGPIKWIHQVLDTHENVSLIITNHLPHLSEAVKEQGAALQELKTDVRETSIKMDGINQRLDDTKAGLHTLGQAFLNHIEHASKVDKKRKK